MNQKILSWAKWLAKSIYAFLSKIYAWIINIPRVGKKYVFDLGKWGRVQLDKHINSEERKYLREVVFEVNTKEGHRFDMVITWVIMASVVVVVLETVSEYHKAFWWIFFISEWIFTLFFTGEYILRLYSSRRPWTYATSFFGIVDLLAVIPTYLSVFFLGAQHLMIVRVLRLMRVFRIFKMGHFVREGQIITGALQASKTKIYVFISFVVLLAIIIGSLLYIVEGGINPKLDNIPKGIYWAVATLTTVGYGDVTPITPFGKFLATFVMIMGYGVIAVPTGIVTAEISSRIMNMKEVKFVACPKCNQKEHHTSAIHCHRCGSELPLK